MSPSRDSILELLQQKGPLLPNDIKKVLGGDTLILGAMLSELSSRKLVKLTSFKRGGSPYYYVPGQEEQLEQCIEHLADKEKAAVSKLKKERVLEDKKLELYERVAFRQTKDFAKELKATTPKGDVIFWRYYLEPEADAIALLRARFAPKKPQPAQEAAPAAPVSPQQTTSHKQTQETQAPSTSATKENEPVPVHDAKPVATSQETKTTSSQPPAPTQQAPTTPDSTQQADLDAEDSQKEKLEQAASQQALYHEPSLEKTPFYDQLITYLQNKGIHIVSEKQVTKNKEYDFVLRVPSAVGELTMVARAKRKKRLNENDVAPALLKAKTLDLPCLFLTPGQFTKKSQEIIAKEYKGLLIIHLDE